MYNKFIITQNGVLVFGNVFLHRDLLPKGDTTCYGGGLWRVDNQSGCILLYGRSFDFGPPQFQFMKRVNEAEPPGSLGYPIFYMRQWLEQEVLEPVWPLV